MQETGRPVSHTATINSVQAVHLLNPPPPSQGQKVPTIIKLKVRAGEHPLSSLLEPWAGTRRAHFRSVTASCITLLRKILLYQDASTLKRN